MLQVSVSAASREGLEHREAQQRQDVEDYGEVNILCDNEVNVLGFYKKKGGLWPPFFCVSYYVLSTVSLYSL